MGLVGGSRSYDGAGLGWAPWKCPRCAAENTGAIDDGCTSCGSGSVKAQHVGVAPPAAQIVHPVPTLDHQRAVHGVESYAEAWADTHDLTVYSHVEAFIAGYLLAQQHAHAQTMTAPPVTAGLAQLAPGGKVRRTIIAALELFKDQVLRDAQEEIASGEWCSVEEAGQLIQQLKAELKAEEEKETTT